MVQSPPWPRRILVGSDGSAPADAAIAAARELAIRFAASVEIVVVHVPEVAVPADPRRAGFDRCESCEREEAARLLRAVRRQRQALLREPRSWPLRLEVGEPVAAIARAAEQSGADLVVLGIGRRDPTERRQGGRTSIFAARQLIVPVYAAAHGCDKPSAAVIVLPDGRTHVPTIRRALACVHPRGSVWIALPKVVSGGAADVEVGTAREIASRACGPELTELLDGVDCQRVDVQGDMLTGVLQLADDVDAQLLAVPVRGLPGPVRTFLPNIAEPLMLTARCSVLATPDEPIAARTPRATN